MVLTLYRSASCDRAMYLDFCWMIAAWSVFGAFYMQTTPCKRMSALVAGLESYRRLELIETLCWSKFCESAIVSLVVALLVCRFACRSTSAI